MQNTQYLEDDGANVILNCMFVMVIYGENDLVRARGSVDRSHATSHSLGRGWHAIWNLSKNIKRFYDVMKTVSFSFILKFILLLENYTL